MKYNVFNGLTHKKINDKPMTRKQADDLVRSQMFWNGYNILNHPYVVQGIYPANAKGWKKFRDDMGWEECGQHYDTFVWAMENNELYFD